MSKVILDFLIIFIYLFKNIKFRVPKSESNLGQLVEFFQFVVNSPQRIEELIAVCFPKTVEGIEWDNPIYTSLYDLEVCYCNRNKIDDILDKQRNDAE